MGIDSFFKWILEEFPGVMVEIGRGKSKQRSRAYDHLLIDFNSELHGVSRKAKTKREAAKLLFRALDFTMMDHAPQISAFIAFDGPAPLAKLLTQRKRRRDRAAKGPIKKGKGSVIDANGLTPGCDTSAELFRWAEYWVYTRCSQRRYRDTVFRLSGPCVAGEGEVKIARQVRSLAERGLAGPTVVISGDADLVVLLLATLGTAPDVVQGDRGTLLSVGRLVKAIGGERRRLDFVALTLLAGNDYLPKMRGCSLARLWRLYKRNRITLVERQGEFGVQLSRSGLMQLVSLFGARDLKEEDLAAPKESSLYDCGHFFAGLEWVFGMYCRGMCPDHGFVYPFPHAPDGKALAHFLRSSEWVPYPVSRFPDPLSPLEFCCALLPLESVHLLPIELHQEMERADYSHVPGENFGSLLEALPLLLGRIRLIALEYDLPFQVLDSDFEVMAWQEAGSERWHADPVEGFEDRGRPPRAYFRRV